MKNTTKYLKLLLNVLFAVIVIFLIIYVMPNVLGFFMPFVIGWIISIIANPLVRWLESRVKIMRKAGSMLIIIAVLALVVVVGYFAISKITAQVISFINDIPGIYESVSEDIKAAGENLDGFYRKLPLNMQEALTEIQGNISGSIGDMVGNIGVPTVQVISNFAKNIPSMLISITFTILSAYFFIADREKILQLGRKYTPANIQEKWRFLSDTFKKAIGGYIKAQIKIMVIIAFILFVGFIILGVNYAILLALLIALLDALPFFGTGTALIPWAIFEFLSGNYHTAIGLVAIYGITQLVRQIIQPKIVGDSIGINPLLSLIFMYIGYKLGGIFGMIIAVPLGMIVINFYKAGAFDNIIKMIAMIGKDFNDFRKL